MYNLGRVVDLLVRILRGERLRPATDEEGREYSGAFIIAGSIAIAFPWFESLVDSGSNLKVWLGVMALVVPMVILALWVSTRLPGFWGIGVGCAAIGIVVIAAMLRWAGVVNFGYGRAASAVAVLCYLGVLLCAGIFYRPKRNN